MRDDSPTTPLSARLAQLPLILAGPILRRTEPHSVTVWVALQQPCEVTVWVFATADNGETIAEVLLKGKRQTVEVGQHLHIVAVTAQPLGDQMGDRALQPGCLYAYDLSFDPLLQPRSSRWETSNGGGIGVPLRQALTSQGCPIVPISYFAHHLPTFSLPPKDLSNLQLVHGSCRKPHGKGSDTLPILDELIQHHASSPNHRPHQLFFTGDQIYGDDIADRLLEALTATGDTLLGWEEHLPVSMSNSNMTTRAFRPCQFPPGQRSETAEALGGFTAGLHHKASYAKSHLFSLGEYCAIYLYVWSPIPWLLVPPNPPDNADRSLSKKAAQRRDAEWAELQRLVQTLGKVRRALANVPTYMIFDDHDISDDWNLNQAWCLRVLGKPLGRQVVQNAMTAYALFQAWGNTPEQFELGRSGELLLNAIAQWSASQGQDLVANTAIAHYLGLPTTDQLTGLPNLRTEEDVFVLDRAPDAVVWHYTLQSDCHRVIVLDTRTQRGYPIHEKATAPAMLLSPIAFKEQIAARMQQMDTQLIPMTILVAPTNLISMQLIDWIQEWNLKQNNVYNNDVGDAWNIHPTALAQLLKTIFSYTQQVVILSGDIHYGSAIRLEYWQEDRHCVLAQLTSSALKNSELKTELVHSRLKSLLPERDRAWVGWNNPPREQELRSPKPFNGKSVPLSLETNSLPNWQYQIHWMPRQPAQSPVWGKHATWLPASVQKSPQWVYRILRWLTHFWRDRWLQEGKEVVGRDNLGLVQFDAQQNSVQQSLYWYAPWKINTIVFSQFQVPLKKSSKLGGL
jgi:hypothetical protein